MMQRMADITRRQEARDERARQFQEEHADQLRQQQVELVNEIANHLKGPTMHPLPQPI